MSSFSTMTKLTSLLDRKSPSRCFWSPTFSICGYCSRVATIRPLPDGFQRQSRISVCTCRCVLRNPWIPSTSIQVLSAKSMACHIPLPVERLWKSIRIHHRFFEETARIPWHRGCFLWHCRGERFTHKTSRWDQTKSETGAGKGWGEREGCKNLSIAALNHVAFYWWKDTGDSLRKNI